MTTTILRTSLDALPASEPAPSALVPATDTALSSGAAFFDLEAMILGGDDDGAPYWFGTPDAGTRAAVLTGSDAADILHGRAGADLLFALEGDDVLQDVRGNNLFDGGAGDDIIEGAGSSLYIGGTGDDTITAWGAGFTLAFNAGDGFDTVILCARGPATISLGLGIDAANVVLRRDGGDLILNTGAGEGMALAGWYEQPLPEALRLQLVGQSATELVDLLALLAGIGDQQSARLVQLALADAGAAGGELAALYATQPGGIEITGANAAIWTGEFGSTAGLGLLL